MPGHWRSSPAFATADGPLLYRRRFGSPADDDPASPASGARQARPARRWWLVSDGIVAAADVWLDGTYLGDTEGSTIPHAFEVTEALRARREHLLAVEVFSPPLAPGDRPAAPAGSLQHGRLLDPAGNPGGIWRPVRLEASGAVRIRHLRTVCLRCRADEAVVAVRAVLDVATAWEAGARVTIETTVGDEQDRRTVPVAAGENRLEWTVRVPHPQRWWPWSLGAQPLAELTVAVHDHDGALSDRRRRRIGLRSVTRRDGVLWVNGERIFLKGANQGPARAALGEASAELLAGDVAAARAAGLDLLRVHTHVSLPAFYDAADEAGLLLWQDLPMHGPHRRSVRRRARRHARELVDLLGHHPSIVLWCAHDEPDTSPTAAAPPRGRPARALAAARLVTAANRPTWNRAVLDRAVRRVLQRSDPSRPVAAHSGVLPHLPLARHADVHLSLGWWPDEERHLDRLLRIWPRVGQFVSALGTPAVPSPVPVPVAAAAGAWADLDWDAVARVHDVVGRIVTQRVPPEAYGSVDAWAAATRADQATLLAREIETLRRLKYRPCGGFAQFAFAAGDAAVGWAVLDHDRHPTPALRALAAACAPVILVVDQLRSGAGPGDTVRLDVHVVSDLRHPLDDADAAVSVTARCDGGTVHELASRRWCGTVEADSVAYVGTVEATLPPTARELRVEGSVTFGHPPGRSPTHRQQRALHPR